MRPGALCCINAKDTEVWERLENIDRSLGELDTQDFIVVLESPVVDPIRSDDDEPDALIARVLTRIGVGWIRLMWLTELT